MNGCWLNFDDARLTWCFNLRLGGVGKEYVVMVADQGAIFIGSRPCRSWKFDSQGGIMGGVLTLVSKWAISIRKTINLVW